MWLARRSRTGRLIAGAVVLLLMSGCGPRPPGGDSAGQVGAGDAAEARAAVGFAAPEIRAIDVSTGKGLTLSEMRGRVVFLNFWATWCGPCRVEMPAMELLHAEFGPRVTILAVGADSREKPEQLAAFAKEMGLTFTIAYDGGDAAKVYRALGLPTSVFVDANGVVRARHTGTLSLEKMRDLVLKVESMSGS